MRMLLGPVLVTVALIGCGGSTTTGTSRSFDDASTSPGGSGGASASEGGSTSIGDAGTFPCGPTRCLANEICVYPPCGCVFETAPSNDAGVCPAGFQPSNDVGTCYVPPNCPTYPPYCAARSPDGAPY